MSGAFTNTPIQHIRSCCMVLYHSQIPTEGISSLILLKRITYSGAWLPLMKLTAAYATWLFSFSSIQFLWRPTSVGLEYTGSVGILEQWLEAKLKSWCSSDCRWPQGTISMCTVGCVHEWLLNIYNSFYSQAISLAPANTGYGMDGIPIPVGGLGVEKDPKLGLPTPCHSSCPPLEQWLK